MYENIRCEPERGIKKGSTNIRREPERGIKKRLENDSPPPAMTAGLFLRGGQ